MINLVKATDNPKSGYPLNFINDTKFALSIKPATPNQYTFYLSKGSKMLSFEYKQLSTETWTIGAYLLAKGLDNTFKQIYSN